MNGSLASGALNLKLGTFRQIESKADFPGRVNLESVIHCGCRESFASEVHCSFKQT